MNEQIQQLISKANNLIPIKRSPNHRYPQKVKHIVATLINEHKIPPKELIKHIPVSLCSAGDWARAAKRSSFIAVKIKSNEKKVNRRHSRLI